jgi:hypothetical protein
VGVVGVEGVEASPLAANTVLAVQGGDMEEVNPRIHKLFYLTLSLLNLYTSTYTPLYLTHPPPLYPYIPPFRLHTHTHTHTHTQLDVKSILGEALFSLSDSLGIDVKDELQDKGARMDINVSIVCYCTICGILYTLHPQSIFFI